MNFADEIYSDATIAPVAGIKELYPELYILGISKDFGNKKIMAVPGVFILMTSKTEKNIN